MTRREGGGGGGGGREGERDRKGGGREGERDRKERGERGKRKGKGHKWDIEHFHTTLSYYKPQQTLIQVYIQCTCTYISTHSSSI